jgi:hypothetical protein
MVGYAELVDVLEMLMGGEKVCACAEVTYRPSVRVQSDTTRQNRPKQLKILYIIPFRQTGLPHTYVFSRIVHGLRRQYQN